LSDDRILEEEFRESMVERANRLHPLEMAEARAELQQERAEEWVQRWRDLEDRLRKAHAELTTMAEHPDRTSSAYMTEAVR